MASPDPDEPLVIDDLGNVHLPDHEGRVIVYSPEPAPQGLDDWAVLLRRIDGQAGPYRVARTPQGRWRCDCHDTKFGRPKRELRQCKHRYAAQKLWTLLRRLTRAHQANQQQRQEEAHR